VVTRSFTARAAPACTANVEKHVAYQVSLNGSDLLAVPQRAAEDPKPTAKDPEPWLAQADAFTAPANKPPVTEVPAKRWVDKLMFWRR
jgi:hypothetical protein